MEGTVMKLPVWMWWVKGECVVKVLSRGHFPTTALVQTPDDRKIEVDICELSIPND